MKKPVSQADINILKSAAISNSMSSTVIKNAGLQPLRSVDSWGTVDTLTPAMKLGNMAFKPNDAAECNTHGSNVGFEIVIEATTDKPKMKLVACKYCMLENMARIIKDAS